MSVTDSDPGAEFRFGRGSGKPVDVAGLQLASKQPALVADDQRGGRRLDGQHVMRTARREAEPAPLSHREAVHAGVAADLAASRVDDRAGAIAGAGLAFDERRVVAVGNEADLLA